MLGRNLRSWGFLLEHTAAGFASINAYAGSGGSEVANLYDTPGNDTFTAQGTNAIMMGNGYKITALGFRSNHGGFSVQRVRSHSLHQ